MRWIYFGTGELSAKLLKALIEKRFIPSLVITGPPKRRGRGLKYLKTPVFEIAHQEGIPVLETSDLEDPVILKKIQMEAAKFFLVFDYGYILPAKLLELPKIAPLNLHPSLLPEYRGAAPIIRAMMDGKETTGITIIKMNEKIDRGEIVYQERMPLGCERTRAEVEEEIIKRAIKIIPMVFEKLAKGEIQPVPQKGKGSYAKKLKKEELIINWQNPASKIVCHIHALSPKPGARTCFEKRPVILLRVKECFEKLQLSPGEIKVINKKLIVGTGKGLIEVLSLKPAGKKEMSAWDFVNGYKPDGKFFR